MRLTELEYTVLVHLWFKAPTATDLHKALVDTLLEMDRTEFTRRFVEHQTALEVDFGGQDSIHTTKRTICILMARDIYEEVQQKEQTL